VSYDAILSKRAQRGLAKLPKSIGRSIADKIRWLAHNAEAVGHERMTGHAEYSLHVGQYRVPYTLDHENRRIIVADIGKHDQAYRRLSRR
jgi:mRNA-degrading endonuclease RelE of RelBE toxin-antitoxin system